MHKMQTISLIYIQYIIPPICLQTHMESFLDDESGLVDQNKT